MESTYEIISSTRNKIVLGLKKDQFLYLSPSKHYTKSNAFNLAMMASVAYLQQNEIEEFLFAKTSLGNRQVAFTGAGNVQSGFLSGVGSSIDSIRESFRMIDEASTDSQFFHFQTESYLLLAFRGTEPTKMKDILSDAGATLVPFPEGAGKVHLGFYKAFKSIEEAISRAVQQTQCKNVILCGHSLGGALGTLAATWIRKKFRREVFLYTYGSPIVGDSDFVRHFTKTDPIAYFRIVHNQDIVTMVPPPHSNLRLNLLPLTLANPFYLTSVFYDPFGKPFNHLGKLVFVRRTKDNAFSVDVDRKTPAFIRIPESITVKEVMDERPKWERFLNWLDVSTFDHSMTNYVSILGSDLKYSVDSYQYAGKITTENSKKIMDYLEAELKSIRNSHNDLQSRMLLPSGGAANADATSTGSTPSNKLTPNEKMRLLEDAMQSKQMELVMQKGYVAHAKAPGFSESILKEIVDLKMSPTLKREFEYQSKNIVY